MRRVCGRVAVKSFVPSKGKLERKAFVAYLVVMVLLFVCTGDD